MATGSFASTPSRAALRRPHLPPAEWFPTGEPSASVRTLELRDGERVRVVDWGAEHDPPVVLLHGWGASAYSFRRLLPLLAAAGWRGIAPDLRGHGLSSKPLDATQYASEAMARHVLQLMDALSLTSAVLVGQSMGGAIAIDAAHIAPDRTRGVVLTGPIGLTAIHRITVARKLRAGRWLHGRVPRWAVSVLLRRVYGTVHTFTPRDIDEYWAPAQFSDFTRALFLFVSAFDWNRRPVDHYLALGTRLRLLIGEYDRLVVPSRVRVRTRALPEDTVQVIPRGGHLLAEETPEVVLEAIQQVAR